jgi:glucan biosynthesis protein C
MANSKRLFYFDNLRVVLMMAVIAHHAAQAYGPTGGSWPIQEPVTSPVLEPFFMVNRSFGMSLFFMIAGYFTVMACDSRCPDRFINSRLRRLGIPLLVYILLMMPLQVFVIGPLINDGARGTAWPVEVAHMWFVEHLLLFSLVYALLRKFSKNQSVPVQREVSPPGYVPILIFAFVLSAVTFLVRLRFPIDYWVNLLGFFRVAFGDVPRDLSLFILGMLAYRYRWVESFSSKAGRVWLAVGIFLAALCYGYTLVIRDVAPISEKAEQLIYPIWESLLCLGLCIGLTILFRDLFNAQGRFGKALADSQYPAYIFHLWVVLIFQFALLNLAAPPLSKFALVTLVSIVVTFSIGYLVRKPLRM